MLLAMLLAPFALLSLLSLTDGGGTGDGGAGSDDADAGRAGSDQTGDKGEDDGKAAGDDGGAKLRETLGKVRQEKRDAEKALREARTELDSLKGRDKGDVERLTGERDRLSKDLEAATGRMRAIVAEQQVRDAAEAANARNARLVWRLVKDDLEVADDGAVTNLDEAIKAAKKDAPELFRQAKADGGANDEREPGTDMNDRIRLAAGRKR